MWISTPDFKGEGGFNVSVPKGAVILYYEMPCWILRNIELLHTVLSCTLDQSYVIKQGFSPDCAPQITSKKAQKYIYVIEANVCL